MLSNAAHYEFTNAEAAASGRSFGDSMCPRLEEREWLNELARTAECRGSFTPAAQAASYTIGLGARDTVATMCPRRAAGEGIVPRLNAVLTVPYYKIDDYEGYTTHSRHFGQFDQEQRSRVSDWVPTVSSGLPTAANFLSALDSEGIKVTPSGMALWTPGMTPGRKLAETLSGQINNLTRAFNLKRSAAWSVGSYAGVFSSSNAAWQRDDGVQISPDAERNKRPFLQVPIWGGSDRYYASCYFKAAWTGSQESWNNIYAYDGTWTYSVADGPWVYSNGARDSEYWALVEFLMLFQVMHGAIWQDEAAHLYTDEYFTVRYYLAPASYALYSATRRNGATSFHAPASVKAIGDAICSTNSVANWPHYQPWTGGGQPTGSTSVIGYEVYVAPVAVVATAYPASRLIGT